MSEERWAAICGGRYEVSTIGRVRNVLSGRVLRPARSSGYLKIGLVDGTGATKRYYVHRLVAEMWVEHQPSAKHEVNHLNGVRHDNRADNLEWVTRSGNIRHSYDILGQARMRGERSGMAKLTEDKVREIRALWRSGTMQKDIAVAFHVARPTVWHIIHRHRWAHID